MSWIFETGSLETPYHQWKSHLGGDRLGKQDYTARAEVATVYKQGGRLLEPEEIPTHVNFENKKPAVRPVNQVENGALVVSEEFRAVLEKFDPGAHQFCPLQLSFKKVPQNEKRYLSNPHILAEALDWEQSATKEVKGFDKKVRTRVNIRKKKVALLQAPGEGGRPHLFRLQGSPGLIAFSDSLQQALQEQKLLRSVPVFQAN